MKLMERILSGKPSAKCLFSYIIMEKGGYLVGAFVLDFSFVPLTQLTFLSNSWMFRVSHEI